MRQRRPFTEYVSGRLFYPKSLFIKISKLKCQEDNIMSLTGKEIAQMHKDYVMQSWSKSGVDALPVERGNIFL